MKLNIEASLGFFHWAKETERVVKTLIKHRTGFGSIGSHHQRCPDHHSLAEVDEIHVPKKETVDPAVTLRYLRSELKRSGLSVSRPGTR